MPDSPDSLSDTFSSSTNNQNEDNRLNPTIKYTGLVVLLVVLSMVAGVLIATTVSIQPVATEPMPNDGGGSVDYSSLYDQTRPSVVSIYSMTEDGRQSQGTGFVYEDGYIVTNYHVISNTNGTIYIRYEGGEWTKASVVGVDKYTDLAVLNPNERPDYAKPLEVQTKLPDRGAKVAVIGTPRGLQGTITTGVVSGTGRSVRTGTSFVLPDMIQTDTSLNPGNSGGPLINRHGEVIGVVNAKQGDNIGFAISARVMDKVATEILNEGEASHSFLGVQTLEVTPFVAEANNLGTTDGVMVVGVFDGSPSDGKLEAASGTTKIEGKSVPVNGDIIVGIEGKSISDGEELGSYLIRKTEPGDTVTLTVIRDGERVKVDVTLTDRPALSGTSQQG